MELLNEKNYSEIMSQKIELFLQSKCNNGYFLSVDNQKIYYEKYINPKEKAKILVLHGFTESSEKFKEMIYYFYLEGFSVFTYDLRGHGKSFKTANKKEVVAESDFNLYSDDLDFFIEKIVKKSSNNTDLYIYAHSLGANCALLYMINHPKIIRKAVLSSPMICGNVGMPIFLATIVLKLLCITGFKNAPVPGKCVFNKDLPFKHSDATSIERYNYYLNKRIIDDDLKTSGPTFGWANASLKAKNKILKNANSIKTDLLLLKAFEDKQVLEKYQDKFIIKNKRVSAKKIENSKHEIFFSENNTLKIYLKEILDFYNNKER